MHENPSAKIHNIAETKLADVATLKATGFLPQNVNYALKCPPARHSRRFDPPALAPRQTLRSHEAFPSRPGSVRPFRGIASLHLCPQPQRQSALKGLRLVPVRGSFLGVHARFENLIRVRRV